MYNCEHAVLFLHARHYTGQTMRVNEYPTHLEALLFLHNNDKRLAPTQAVQLFALTKFAMAVNPQLRRKCKGLFDDWKTRRTYHKHANGRRH